MRLRSIVAGCFLLPALFLPAQIMALTLTSPAFNENGTIPDQFVYSYAAQCQGSNQSPPLVIGDAPAGARSFALTVIDPDGGNWLHWKAWNISGTTVALPHNAAAHSGFPQATNDFGTSGYGGPCPPTPNHRYIFTLYALTTTFTSEPTVTELQGAALQTATLTGLRSPTDSLDWVQATGGLNSSDRLFNWAEYRYAQLFSPPASVTESQFGYYYRFYSQTNSYLGSKDGRIYYIGPDGSLVDLGQADSYLPSAAVDGF